MISLADTEEEEEKGRRSRNRCCCSNGRKTETDILSSFLLMHVLVSHFAKHNFADTRAAQGQEGAALSPQASSRAGFATGWRGAAGTTTSTAAGGTASTTAGGTTTGSAAATGSAAGTATSAPAGAAGGTACGAAGCASRLLAVTEINTRMVALVAAVNKP